MRLWSVHPRYLDTKGLLAVWREGLLAQKVLEGRTKGYTRHPQLDRFRASDRPLDAIRTYLAGIAAEAHRRRYRFDAQKIGPAGSAPRIAVTSGQIDFERRHLLAKLAARDPNRRKKLAAEKTIEPHPLFLVTAGPIEPWEKT
jgi:hypothetical protein